MSEKRDYKKEFVDFVLQELSVKPKVPTNQLIHKFRQKVRPSRYSRFPNNFELEQIMRMDIMPMLQLAIRSASILNESLKAFVDKEWQPSNFLEQKVEFIEQFLQEIMRAIKDNKYDIASSKLEIIRPIIPEVKSTNRYRSIQDTMIFLDDMVGKWQDSNCQEKASQ